MIGLRLGRRVFVYARATDMRKSFDTLGALAREAMGRDPVSGEVYVFVGRCGRRAKLLWWDGTGTCVLAKRLGVGRFVRPWRLGPSATLEWTESELMLFLEGSEYVGHRRLSPTAWARSTDR